MLFLTLLRRVALLGHGPAGAADRALLAIRDVLRELVGPTAAAMDLPVPKPAVAVLPPEAGEPPDIKILAQICRTMLEAYYIDPEALAASEAERAQALMAAEEAWLGQGGLDVVSSAPSPQTPAGPFNPCPGQCPLPRGLAFMEHSALLQVVHSKLSGAQFKDVSGSTDQLSAFSLRGLRVLWFHLNRCTSTLKRDSDTSASNGRRSVNLILVLRNLRFCGSFDWEATLATFPYLHLEGGGRVVVENLAISIRASLGHRGGMVFRLVETGQPELDVQLQCASVFSQVVLSAVLRIFQAFLQDHIKQQMQQFLLSFLQQEASRWNASMWDFITQVAPEHLISDSLSWIDTQIPPEGLPI